MSNIAFLAIGDELLDGRRVESNSTTFATLLAQRGHALNAVHRVADRIPDIVEALEGLAAHHTLIATSGGLGVTSDDRTRQAVARFLGMELELDVPSLASIRARVERRGYSYSPDLEGHATHPATSTVVPNPAGLAIGFVATRGNTRVLTLPGVRHEFEAMARQWIEAEFGAGETLQRRWTLFGITERTAEQRLSELKLPAGVHFGICPHDGPLEITLTGPRDRVEAIDGLEQLLEPHVIGSPHTIPEALGAALLANGQTMSTAESCTGGLIASLVTDIGGSSGYFLEGAVTYSNQAKVRQLGVQQATLDRHGAVSKATVIEMATGIRRVTGADWGVASSGIAGPGGGTPTKPVGLVQLCVAGPEVTEHRTVYFPNMSRLRVKRRAAYAALTLLTCAVKGVQAPTLSVPPPSASTA